MTAASVMVVHGAGSSPDVAKGAFAGTLPASELTSWWLRGHGPRPAEQDADIGDIGGIGGIGGIGSRAGRGHPADPADLADLAAAVRARRPTTLAGISYGAHLAARWAGQPPDDTSSVRRLLLILPAWTGPPGAVAALTSAQADTFDRVGVAAELARIRREHPGWVADALAASWPHHHPAPLISALRAIAASSGPTEAELMSIRLPTAVVAAAHDPLHPAEVARRWAACIPDARLVVVDPTALADLGARGWGALGNEVVSPG